MSNRPKTDWGPYSVHATYLGPKPGDFPVGSLQSRAAARAMVAFYQEELRKSEEAALAIFTPSERASVQAMIEETDSPLTRMTMIRLMIVARERGIVFEQPVHFPTPEETRHIRAVRKEIDRMTDGKASSIENSDHIEWNRLVAIAEENLRAKKK